MTLGRGVMVVVLLVALIGLAAGQQSTEAARAEKQITAIAHQMYEAEKRKDLNFVLSNLAPDFAEVAGDGRIYHRSDIEAGWADVVLNDYKLLNCVFKLMTHDAAYLSCNMEIDATYKGTPFPRRMSVTTVWTKMRGRWLVRFEQSTIIPEPPKKAEAP